MQVKPGSETRTGVMWRCNEGVVCRDFSQKQFGQEQWRLSLVREIPKIQKHPSLKQPEAICYISCLPHVSVSGHMLVGIHNSCVDAVPLHVHLTKGKLAFSCHAHSPAVLSEPQLVF